MICEDAVTNYLVILVNRFFFVASLQVSSALKNKGEFVFHVRAWTHLVTCSFGFVLNTLDTSGLSCLFILTYTFCLSSCICYFKIFFE